MPQGITRLIEIARRWHETLWAYQPPPGSTIDVSFLRQFEPADSVVDAAAQDAAREALAASIPDRAFDAVESLATACRSLHGIMGDEQVQAALDSLTLAIRKAEVFAAVAAEQSDTMPLCSDAGGAVDTKTEPPQKRPPRRYSPELKADILKYVVSRGSEGIWELVIDFCNSRRARWNDILKAHDGETPQQAALRVWEAVTTWERREEERRHRQTPTKAPTSPKPRQSGASRGKARHR